jgi:hypothetical protein
MSFTVRLTFAGLGLALVHAKRDEPEVVTGVDLLLVDSMKAREKRSYMSEKLKKKMEDMPNHEPRLTFRLEDLAKTGEGSFPGPHVVPNGSPLVELSLEEQDLVVKVVGGSDRCKLKRPFRSTAVRPGFLASSEAINWIPDADQNLGLPISDIIIPGETLKDSPYISRLKLPPGDITSSSLLILENGDLSEAVYGDDTTSHALAEYLVWTLREVDRFEIPYKTGLVLDDEVRRLQDESPVVEVSVTNLPETFLPERYPFPDHFPMFHLISKTGKEPRLVRPKTPRDVTRGGTCPPLVAELIS